jgi:pimeloyl-ACP methyl ester carboxylesterase
MTATSEVTILIHGLWMNTLVLLPQQFLLSKLGLEVRRYSYRSVCVDLQSNIDALNRFVSTTNCVSINLVGHSLGGLLILGMLAKYDQPRVHRVVLMGSPCMGCYSASFLARQRLLSAVPGRSLMDWLDLPRRTISRSVEIGILSGSRSLGLGRLIPGLPTPNDGVVAVEETGLPEATDFVTIPVAHAEMLFSRTCAIQVASFLKNGRFLHG